MACSSPIEESKGKDSNLPENISSASEETIDQGAKDQEGVCTVPEPSVPLALPLLKPIAPRYHAQCLEIFEVRISYRGRKTSGKIHGHIYCSCAMGIRDIYKRNKSNAENVSFPGTITLSGLPIAIRADDPFVMCVQLWHGNEEVSEGSTVVRNPILWCLYNEVITDEVKGRNGAAVLTYAVITNAVIASVEVSLVKGNRKAGARTYGTINASMSGWDAKRMLFNRKRDKYIHADSGAQIPLLRSVLIIPHTSSLDIDVDLADAFSYPNVPIAKGTVRFSEKLRGDVEETVSGKYGKIKVKVTWWSYYDHPDTYIVRDRYDI